MYLPEDIPQSLMANQGPEVDFRRLLSSLTPCASMTRKWNRFSGYVHCNWIWDALLRGLAWRPQKLMLGVNAKVLDAGRLLPSPNLYPTLLGSNHSIGLY